MAQTSALHDDDDARSFRYNDAPDSGTVETPFFIPDGAYASSSLGMSYGSYEYAGSEPEGLVRIA